jgi:hypothetical protein
MFDLRESKTIQLTLKDKLSPDYEAYLYHEPITSKIYVVKFFPYNDPEAEMYLITEFRKLALLSAEPEMGTVYGLVNVKLAPDPKPYAGYLMDFVYGESLEVLIKNGEISFEVYATIAAQITAGLEKAAHYGVKHHDIHSGNVMIDRFGYVKLVDFFWNDWETDPEKDLKDFKKMMVGFYDAVQSKDRLKAETIHHYYQQIKTFSSATKTIQKLKDISTTLALMDDMGKIIIAALLTQIDEGFRLGLKFVKSAIKINPQFIPDLTEEEKIHMENGAKGPFRFMDSRHQKIQNMIKEYLVNLFSQLKNAQLCDVHSSVVNKGEKFKGPYELDIQIEIFIELVRWKEIYQEFQFLQEIKEDDFLEQLFSHEWIDELYMYNALTNWPNMKA